jgi:hypothetical protein
MAQRKPSSTSGTRKSTAKSTPPADKRPRESRPPAKKPGKSIVNQKQTPWGLIVTTGVVIVFAAAIIVYAVTRPGKKGSTDPWNQPELADAKAIPGLVYNAEPNHDHVNGVIKYDTTPPTGGNHSPVWADCTGTVYPNAIANENAVHMLEHGAVWITYKPGLAKSQVDTLSKLVSGQDRMAMSPYPGLKTNVSLQAWGYQLFVDSASDPRVQNFITALKFNPKTTPETSATCSDPSFKTNPSTPGHPIDG